MRPQITTHQRRCAGRDRGGCADEGAAESIDRYYRLAFGASDWDFWNAQFDDQCSLRSGLPITATRRKLCEQPARAARSGADSRGQYLHSGNARPCEKTARGRACGVRFTYLFRHNEFHAWSAANHAKVITGTQITVRALRDSPRVRKIDRRARARAGALGFINPVCRNV